MKSLTLHYNKYLFSQWSNIPHALQLPILCPSSYWFWTFKARHFQSHLIVALIFLFIYHSILNFLINLFLKSVLSSTKAHLFTDLSLTELSPLRMSAISIGPAGFLALLLLLVLPSSPSLFTGLSLTVPRPFRTSDILTGAAGLLFTPPSSTAIPFFSLAWKKQPVTSAGKTRLLRQE